LAIRVQRPGFLFFLKKVAAEPFEWRVGAPQRSCGVSLTEKVLGGDGEGGQSVQNSQKKEGVGDRIQGQVPCVLRGGSWLEPWDVETTARILPEEDSMVRGVSVEGGSLN